MTTRSAHEFIEEVSGAQMKNRVALCGIQTFPKISPRPWSYSRNFVATHCVRLEQLLFVIQRVAPSQLSVLYRCTPRIPTISVDFLSDLDHLDLRSPERQHNGWGI